MTLSWPPGGQVRLIVRGLTVNTTTLPQTRRFKRKGLGVNIGGSYIFKHLGTLQGYIAMVYAAG